MLVYSRFMVSFFIDWIKARRYNKLYKLYNANFGGEKMKEKMKDDKYIGSAKVGPKGQIVIPKEVRDMFDISPGDTLIVLADAEKGIAIERFSTFNQIADAIFSGKAKELYPEHSEEDSISFAKSIKAMKEEVENE